MHQQQRAAAYAALLPSPVRRARMAVRYGTFRFCVLRTSHLEPCGTNVPYFSSVFEAYRTNVTYHYKKSVPYFLAKIEAYGVPYCHPCFNYSQLLTVFKTLVYKLAISIQTFSVDFSCFLTLSVTCGEASAGWWGIIFFTHMSVPQLERCSKGGKICFWRGQNFWVGLVFTKFSVDIQKKRKVIAPIWSTFLRGLCWFPKKATMLKLLQG